MKIPMLFVYGFFLVLPNENRILYVYKIVFGCQYSDKYLCQYSNKNMELQVLYGIIFTIPLMLLKHLTLFKKLHREEDVKKNFRNCFFYFFYLRCILLFCTKS